MAIALGSSSTVEVAINGATLTYAALGKITGGTFNFGTALADITNNDSAGYTEVLYADSTMTLQVDARYDPTDTVQTNAMAYCAAKTDASGTYLSVRVRPQVGSGLEQWAFRAYVESFNVTMPHGEVVDISISFRGSGAPTLTAQ